MIAACLGSGEKIDRLEKIANSGGSKHIQILLFIIVDRSHVLLDNDVDTGDRQYVPQSAFLVLS